jgi:hypothetical protein
MDAREQEFKSAMALLKGMIKAMSEGNHANKRKHDEAPQIYRRDGNVFRQQSRIRIRQLAF